MNSVTHYPRPTSVTPLFRPEPDHGLPCDCEPREALMCQCRDERYSGPDPMAGDYDAAQFDHLTPNDPQPDPTFWQSRRARLVYLAMSLIALGFLAVCAIDLYNRWGMK